MAEKDGFRKPQGYFYRYLTDAREPEQGEYAVFYNDKSEAVHVQAFTAEGMPRGFTAGETVFAFDDDPARDGKTGILHVKGYEIGIDAQGKPAYIQEAGMRFRVGFEAVDPAHPAGDTRITYAMTEDSRARLRAEKFSADFPKTFAATVDGGNKGIVRGPDGLPMDVTEDLSRNLHFPPHHAYDRAIAARTAVDEDYAPRGFAPPLVLVGEFAPAARKGPPPRPENPSVSERAFVESLQKYGTPMGRGKPVIGRDAEIREAAELLSTYKKANPCLVGEAGVGKSEIAEGIAQWLARGEGVPENLKGARLYKVDLTKMQAIPNAGLRGAVEKEFRTFSEGWRDWGGWVTLPGEREPCRIIPFFDELHAQLMTGSASNTANVGELLKDVLTTPGLASLSATTADEYTKHLGKDPAQARRFPRVFVDPPDAAKTLAIAEAVLPTLEAHHGRERHLSPEDIRYAHRLSDRYVHDVAQPDRLLSLLDRAGAKAAMRGAPGIEKQDLDQTAAAMAHVPPAHLDQSNAAIFRRMEKELPEIIIDQPAVVDIAKRLKAMRAGTTRDPRKPLGTILMAGPSRVGKTETARIINRILNGNDDSLIRLNMAEYSEKHTAARLIGAPPGYVGHESEGALTGPVRKNPYSVVLLDEIEKAHPDVFNALLGIFDDGRTTDSKGRMVDFTNVFFVLTTNIGSRAAMEKIQKARIGFGNDAPVVITEDDLRRRQKEIEKDQTGAINGFFPPEFLNRVNEGGGIFFYNSLSKNAITQLVDREIAALNDRLADTGNANMPGVRVEIGEKARAELADLAYDPVYNAGKVVQVVNDRINIPLADWILDEGKRAELDVRVQLDGGVRFVIDGIEGGLKHRLEPPLNAGAAFAAAAQAPAPANDDAAPSSTRRVPSVRPPRMG